MSSLPEITVYRYKCQRYSVTENRYACFMSIGARVKYRLKEMGLKPTWLIKATRMRPSTVYDILNGSQKSSTQLPTIAHHLGMHPLWLEKEIGPRLLSETPQKMPLSPWPFLVEEERIRALNPVELSLVEAAMVGVLKAIEAHHPTDGHGEFT